MRHVKSLDGLRAVAVLLVILYHYGYLECGWIGVQVFFVLSGYLITNILLHDKKRSYGAYLKRFYWRRVLRIFPLYYGYLALITVVFLAAGWPPILSRLWESLYSYTYNFARLARDDPGGLPFVHFWSLAIEEQFYVLWPTLVFLLPLRAFKRFIVALVFLAPLFRFALAAWLGPRVHDPVYVGHAVNMVTTSHLDAFAWGGAVAVFGFHGIRNPLRIFRWALAGAVTLGLVFLAWEARHGISIPWSSLGYPNHPHRGLAEVWSYTVVNGVSALAVLSAVRGAPPARFLLSRVMMRIGKISYGVYVFHLPMLGAVRKAIPAQANSPGGAALFVGYLLVVVAVSELSFRLFESRFLAWKGKFGETRPGEAAGE
jgi:peptidoglycan/LPS O-acetylase OafA/YrhL